MQRSRITILSSDHQLLSHILLRLHSKGCQATTMPCDDLALGKFYSDPPDLMIIDLSDKSECSAGIITTLRSDSYFSVIPIIGLVNIAEDDIPDWHRCPLDDFLGLPLNFNELFIRISLAFSRIKRIFDNNPLTRLPGNTSIQNAIETALGTPTAVCYVDINHFKPYNDAYGFSHGDEVIRMTARIMFNAVHNSGGGFCGHIGGDDFVCIVALDQVETVCRTIIDHFDMIVLDLFDDETKQSGTYPGTNRRGEKENIPLLSVSIGVVPMNRPKLQHVAKVTEVAAEVKKLAKKSGGSCYVIDNRSS
ncbi:MAG: diguanylate cyclase [Desulfuromonadaceae bacterium]|nr:diguanylate cyclase [Desulfuromonadaceae bacterium]